MRFALIAVVYFISIICPSQGFSGNVYFYTGAGTGPVGVQKFREFLKKTTRDEIFEVKTSEEMNQLLREDLDKSQMSIVIPGGDTFQISKSLKPAFLAIQNSVWGGATYFGICAGATLAASSFDFNLETGLLPDSLLSLIQAKANHFSHPAIKIMRKDAQGRFVNIAIPVEDGSSGVPWHRGNFLDGARESVIKVFWNRGGYFNEFAPRDIHSVAEYVNDKVEDPYTHPLHPHSAAIVTSRYGQGVVIASQVHLEFGMLAEVPRSEYEAFYTNHANYAAQQLASFKVERVNEVEEQAEFSRLLLRWLIQQGNFKSIN